jgi:hypothetical protein
MAKRQTQPEANYGRGDPTEHCGICQYYLGAAAGCSKVMGKISPYGMCDLYFAVTNNFGKTLAPAEVAAIKRMAADAADRSGG